MFDHKEIRNRNLQCLRGIAIIMVIITHALYMFIGAGHFNNTFDFAIGVDLFFVISGYLMGLTFISKITENITLKDAFDFYKKRINRLFNTNLFWSFFILIFASLWVKTHNLPSQEFSAWLFLSNISFLSNIFNAFHTNNFGYFWTLGTEVQFYLALPLLLFLFRKFFISVVILILFILTFLNPIPIEFQWIFRWNSLFIGILIWKITTSSSFKLIYDDIILWSNWRKIFILLFLFCSMASFARIIPLQWSIKSTIIGVGIGIVMITILSSNKIIFGILSKYIEKLGDISYSWYLCHIPTWVLVSYLLDQTGFIIFGAIRILICVLVSILFASLSYRYIESSGRSKSAIK